MNNTVFMFCKNPLELKKPDFGYENEYKEVEQSAYSQYLFDFDTFVQGEKIKIPFFEKTTKAIYRGWMMSPEVYNRFYCLMQKNNCFLINTPEQYQFCHTLPGWYNEIEGLTPESRWTQDLSDNAVQALLDEFGNSPVVIKDFVKSRKHEWLDACYIQNAADTNHAMNVIHNFIERQGTDLIGGLVVREFVDLKRMGNHPKSNMPISEEYRAFFLDGEIVCVIDYWNGVESTSEEVATFAKKVSNRINSTFFTVDIARKADGTLIIMEIGDGQVSGLQGFSESTFFSNLFSLL